MKLASISHKAFRISCLVVLLILAVVQLRLLLFEQSEYSQKTDLSSLHKYQSNPYLLSWLAKQKHLFAADMDTAQSLYQQALTANSVYLPAWFGLAELKFDQQQTEEANAILDYTTELAKDIKRWRWDKALVAYQFDRKDILAGDLSYIIRKESSWKKRNDALRMAFSVWQDPVELLGKMGNDNLLHLFRYATNKKKVEEGVVLWKVLERQGFKENEKDVYRFLNMLLSNGEINTAADIWEKYFNPDTLLFNGDFNQEPLQTAFGWRIGKNKGVSWKIKAARKKGEPPSLHLHFNRKKNVNLYNIQQIIPLQGGKVYTFKAKAKTAKLSTEQLPYWEIHGFKCKGLYQKTEMVQREQGWTDTALSFGVPEACDAIRLRLRRKESTQIDNKLSGDIWLTGLEIEETDEYFTILDEQQ